MRGLSTCSAWLGLLLGLVSGNPLQDGSGLEKRATGDLCFLNNQKMAIIGDRLYFMGGDYHFDGDAAGKTNSSSKLRYLDLAGSATISGDSIISSDEITSIDIPTGTVPTLQNQTRSGGGSLFYSLDSFYVFSGVGETDTANNILALYNTTSNAWSSHTVSGGNYNRLNRLFGGSASIPSTGLSFFSGGGNAGTFKPGQPTGLLRFDASDPSSLTWRNETSTSNGGVAPPARVGGNMVYVPMGKQGVLLVWGGYNGAQVNATTGAPAFTYDIQDNKNIYVYDIASATWYIVQAQGDIPSVRTETCSVISAAPDYSSFNVAMYGGWFLYGGEAYSDTYVLSVPSFRWVKISSSNYTGSNNEAILAQANLPRGRHQHKCAVYNDAQMIVLGGIVNNNGTDLPATCDQQEPPLRILNLATMTWAKQFDAKAQYTVPQEVYQVIGGSGSGGARISQPDGGFNDTAVASIFATTVARAASTASTTLGAATGSGKSSGSSSGSSSHTGAIVGGVVGGVGGLLILGALVWFLLRRRQRNKHEAVPQTEPGYDNTQRPQQHGMGNYYAPPGSNNNYPPGPGGGEKNHRLSEMDANHNMVVEADAHHMIGELEGDVPREQKNTLSQLA